MEKKNKLIKTAAALLSLGVAVGAPAVYFLRLRARTANALWYEAEGMVVLIAASILAAAFLWFFLRDRGGSFELSEEEEREETFEECSEGEWESSCPCPDTEFAREEYPELFREGIGAKNEEHSEGANEYLENLRTALELMKKENAEYLVDDLTDVGEDDMEEDLTGEKIGEIATDLLSDIPDTLPEGYVPYDPEEETEEDEEKGMEIESPSRSRGASLFAAAAIAAALPFALALALSCCTTVCFDDTLVVSGVFKSREYSCAQAVSVQVAPSFFGDSVSVSLEFEGGERVSILSSGAVYGKEFHERYENEYTYALSVVSKAESAGAKKVVKERSTIESNFFHREDVGEYIKKLVD